MVETGFNKTQIGKIILAACFVNDLGTVLALGIVFAHYDLWLAFFGGVTALALWMLPRFAPWFFAKVGHRVSEPETKFVALVLLGLGGMATVAGSEAVLPAYLVGMALAPGIFWPISNCHTACASSPSRSSLHSTSSRPARLWSFRPWSPRRGPSSSISRSRW